MIDLFSEVLRVRPGQAGSLLVGPDSGQGFLYGGLTMAVAIRAAAAAVEQPLVPMSMRTSFLSLGAWGSIQADVQAVHDSRSSRAPEPANGSCSTPSRSPDPADGTSVAVPYTTDAGGSWPRSCRRG